MDKSSAFKAKTSLFARVILNAIHDGGGGGGGGGVRGAKKPSPTSFSSVTFTKHRN